MGRRIEITTKRIALSLWLFAFSGCVADTKTATISAGSSAPSPTPTQTQAACTGGAKSVAVSWNANHEKAVNTTGGGYVVYYSTLTPLNTSTACSVTVPYASGASSPTSKTVTSLVSGTWHFKIVAFSAINLPGSTGGSRSPASSEVSVVVP